MDLVQFDGVEVEYELVGDGEPVALLHARPFVDWYGPLVERLSGWTVLRSRRRVDPERASTDPPFAIADDAIAFERLVAHVGIDRPHVVGHSYGGLVALEIARRGQVDVRSLALLEPAASGFVEPARAAAATAPLLEVVATQGAAAAMQRFIAAVAGERGAEQLEAAVPGAVGAATTHAEQFFAVELPAVCRWQFGADDARRLTSPALVMAGTASDDRFIRAVDDLHGWLEEAKRVDIDGATHLLMADHPNAVADALVTFWRGN